MRFAVDWVGGLVQFLAALGHSLQCELPPKALAAAGHTVDRPPAPRDYWPIQGPHPLCGQPGAVSPLRAQWPAGAVGDPRRRDAAVTAVSPQQLVVALVAAHRLHRRGALCAAGSVVEPSEHASARVDPRGRVRR